MDVLGQLAQPATKVSIVFAPGPIRTELRSTLMIEHARRSLISCALRAWTTAARLAAGVTIFCRQVLENGVVEHGVGKELPQPVVLILQSLQPLGVGNLEPAILGPP
jgi:hypothetical protein